MHIADGVLSTPVMVTTFALTAVAIGIGIKDTKEDDIPKISLMAGTFFAVSLITIPIPPSSVHPMLVGLIGIILGRKSALAFFPALLLQALLFKHGGLTSLGANTLMLTIGAVFGHLIYRKLKVSPIVKGALSGFLSLALVVVVLITLLYLSNEIYSTGAVSPINLLIVSHIPLAIAEGLITGFAANFIEKSKPNWIS